MQPVAPPATQSFHLGDLLSVTDGKLVSPDHIDGVYRLLDFVTGEKHMTHQLPRAVGVVKPWLLRQHPWLADINVPAGLSGKEAVMSWLATATQTVGSFHTVEAMPFGMYVGREPIAEFREMNPRTSVISFDELDGGVSA